MQTPHYVAVDVAKAMLSACLGRQSKVAVPSFDVAERRTVVDQGAFKI